jgi:hypothetical protein
MAANNESELGYFLLSAWCTHTKSWQDMTPRFVSPGDAEQAVAERGIYRVVFVHEGRRLPCEPFALVGGNDDG